VLGIQNANGTAGVCPPGRNTGQWTTSNESWRFAPAIFPVKNIYACTVSTVLDAGFPNTNTNYLWSTGNTTQTITVTIQGMYYVTVTNPTIGTETDSINVHFTHPYMNLKLRK